MSAPAPHLVWAQVVARNIVPLCGILFLGWSAASTLILYFADTLLSIAVLFAGVLRHFAPPVTDDGWAARINGEVGMLAGGAFCALAVSVPLGIPLIFMLVPGNVSWSALLSDPALQAGIVWQLIAAFWSYLGLWRALHHATPEELRLKRRFALVFLRWIVLVIVALSPVGMLFGLFGRYSPILFVALYAVVSIWSEIAPDRFLRFVPGGAEDADPPPPVPPAATEGAPRTKRRHRR